MKKAKTSSLCLLKLIKRNLKKKEWFQGKIEKTHFGFLSVWPITLSLESRVLVSASTPFPGKWRRFSFSLESRHRFFFILWIEHSLGYFLELQNYPLEFLVVTDTPSILIHLKYEKNYWTNRVKSCFKLSNFIIRNNKIKICLKIIINISIFLTMIYSKIVLLGILKIYLVKLKYFKLIIKNI